MFGRSYDQKRVRDLLSRFPAVGIVGARQVGKTTLAREISGVWEGPVSRFDLQDPADVARLADPMLALRDLEGLVVIDEIQELPELFPVLRVLIDRPDCRAQFLVLGSASPELLRQGAESLAGRIHYYELKGFSLEDTSPAELDRLWLRGGFPRSYLAQDDPASIEWRHSFLRAFLERDLPQLGIDVAPRTMRRFWTMLAHLHGQVLNASELARSFGVSDVTVRKYLDHLTSALVVQQLGPWHENLNKRQVKAPKVLIADSGILHALLNLPTHTDLSAHPKLGASWEGFLIGQVVSRLGVSWDECWFWATHSGAELDLLVVRGRTRLGFEFKRSVSPKRTRSMLVAQEDLKLDRIDVVHAGAETFPLGDAIRAVAAERLLEDVGRIG